MQYKLTKGDLLDKDGNLAKAGYATSLVRTYDRKKIKAGKLRIKEWDYYLIYNQQFGVALTVDDNSYMGLTGISFLDFTNRTEKTVNLMTALPMGKTGLPSSSDTGVTHFRDKRCYFSFKVKDGKRILLASMENFDQGQPIRMKIILSEEPEDSMVIATPFEKPGHFYYNQKIVGMRAKGVVESWDKNIILTRKTVSVCWTGAEAFGPMKIPGIGVPCREKPMEKYLDSISDTDSAIQKQPRKI